MVYLAVISNISSYHLNTNTLRYWLSSQVVCDDPTHATQEWMIRKDLRERRLAGS